MKNVPRPSEKIDIGTDKSEEYLKRLKDLFNAIDPENIIAHIKGDKDFPSSHYDIEVNVQKLEDAYDLHLMIYIQFFQPEYHSAFGVEAYCCPCDTAFGNNWVTEVDDELDTLDDRECTWEELYNRIIEVAKKRFSRVPKPPETK